MSRLLDFARSHWPSRAAAPRPCRRRAARRAGGVLRAHRSSSRRRPHRDLRRAGESRLRRLHRPRHRRGGAHRRQGRRHRAGHAGRARLVDGGHRPAHLVVRGAGHRLGRAEGAKAASAGTFITMSGARRGDGAQHAHRRGAPGRVRPAATSKARSARRSRTTPPRTRAASRRRAGATPTGPRTPCATASPRRPRRPSSWASSTSSPRTSTRCCAQSEGRSVSVNGAEVTLSGLADAPRADNDMTFFERCCSSSAIPTSPSCCSASAGSGC